MQRQLKITLPRVVAEKLRLDALAQDRSQSYILAKLLIAHYDTGELPLRAGRPMPDVETAGRLDSLTPASVIDGARSGAASIADKYLSPPKGSRYRG